MKKILVVMVLAMALVWGVGVRSASAWFVDFNVHANTNLGSISYDGMGGTLVGNNIDVDDVVVKLGNNNSLLLTNAKLNFATGNFLSFADDGTNKTWRFGSGGYIVITSDDYSASLMSGAWDNAMVITLFNNGLFQLDLAGGAYTDQKNGKMLNDLGLFGYANDDELVGAFVGGLNLAFMAMDLSGTTNGFESLSVVSGDVPNTPVPVPAAAWLLGSGLLGLVGIRRRKN